MAIRSDWLRSRRRLLEQVKYQVNRRLGPPPRDIAQYTRAYNAEFARPWTGSNQQNLLTRINSADVVLGADFHAFSQSQRIHLRLLRERDSRRPAILALEAFSNEDQKWLDSYSAGRINETALLTKTRWSERWGFPWENYAPLVRLAKEQKMRIVGIDVPHRQRGKMSLQRRDRYSAKIITGWQAEFPGHLLYVIIGDLHLAQGHLPRELQNLALKSERRLSIVTVLQNSEHLYFRLARNGREHHVEVLSAARDRFCVISSPPWVKWQSYLMYLESTYDRELAADRMDLTDHVAQFCIFLSQEIGVNSDLSELAVYTPENGEVMGKWRERLSPAKRKIFDHLLRSDKSFYFVEKGALYLSRLSINHAATLAGQYLHANLCDRQRDLWQFPQDFLPAIWVEAVGFFCSKLINHRRKAEGVDDLRLKLDGRNPKGQAKEAMKLALQQRLREVRGHGGRPPKRFRRQSYIEAAQILGAMLGERMYRGYSRKRLSMDEIVEWLQSPVDASGFDQFYAQVISRCESFAVRGNSK